MSISLIDPFLLLFSLFSFQLALVWCRNEVEGARAAKEAKPKEEEGLGLHRSHLEEGAPSHYSSSKAT